MDKNIYMVGKQGFHFGRSKMEIWNEEVLRRML